MTASDTTSTMPRGDSQSASQLRGAASQAISSASDWLLARQHADGYWCAELEGDSILQSETILLFAWLGEERSPQALRAAEYLSRQQLPTGGWGMYPGGGVEISGSVKAYFALKLTGRDPESAEMQLARQAILAHGGADRVNSFTRFYLALLGQIPYEHCPAVPPEAMLLPNAFPASIYQISAWSRTIFVPLSIMWAHRPVRQLTPEQSIAELFIEPPERWPPLRSPGLKANRGLFTWERFFRYVDGGLKFLERARLRPLRQRGLKAAEKWMLDRFQQSDGLGAIYPPIVWSLVALKCLGYADDSPEVQSCRDELQKLAVEEPATADHPATTHWQPCKSPVWDTALTLRALAAAGVNGQHPACQKAIDWLLQKEVRSPGDWSTKVAAEPAGWYFEHNNEFYPDIDDTIMVMMALREQLSEVDTRDESLARDADKPAVFSAAAKDLQHAKAAVGRVEAVTQACRRAQAWVLAMQNRDGGWGAFDRDNDAAWLCQVPFADHNAMIDPSTPDIAARVVEALAGWGLTAEHPTVQKALSYIREQQEEDGAWFGRWGVNYLYGVWQVLVGLRAIGTPTDDPAVVAGVEWLLGCQQPCGGWGETPDTYEDPSLRGTGPVTPSQTAWALLGLQAVLPADHPAVLRGVEYLTRTQNADGSWDEPYFTGTGFPRVFYLRYHYYRIYFPLQALAGWESMAQG
ncbi:terpene cyclase/mutase family protein [Lignipirellula cremea]|uniref:Squalene--hopene cyclase n=1 Tax=Lignipirellula cremea TaxID=2528010 RepID=A0A518DRK3_9BACT|nr:prenyltransferase/squalene oxidase repeat-containing protein [Lignipirellula cremea]QDU94444.1 Squalene--hopene cyclase [Lignipirellula cremea]